MLNINNKNVFNRAIISLIIFANRKDIFKILNGEMNVLDLKLISQYFFRL